MARVVQNGFSLRQTGRIVLAYFCGCVAGTWVIAQLGNVGSAGQVPIAELLAAVVVAFLVTPFSHAPFFAVGLAPASVVAYLVLASLRHEDALSHTIAGALTVGVTVWLIDALSPPDSETNWIVLIVAGSVGGWVCWWARRHFAGLKD